MNRLLCGIFLLIYACRPSVKENSIALRTYSVDHANGFYFEEREPGTYLIIAEPYPDATEPKEYPLGSVPKKIVCTSTSHLPYLELLGVEEAVVGFPNLNYISSATFIERAEKGLITDLGPDGSINMELLIGLAPDAVIAYDMGGESQSLDKIEEAGIPVFYNSDFLEQSPLGRAEWIKFFGALMNKREAADSIFNAIEAEYLRVQTVAKSRQHTPSILSGVVYGDSWFLPGGNNWAANFFESAGGKYLWASDTVSGWMELSFEAVYAQAHNADYWIGTSTFNSMSQLEGQDERYTSFRAFAEDRVYNYNKRIGPNGGYDFFESGYSRPDLVLSDLIKILHPELLPEYETTYFQKLQ